MVLFVMFGWSKLTGFSGTVAYMTSTGAPVPELSAVIAVVMEFVVGIALLVGFYTRPLALLLALYTLGTAIIGHHYWNMTRRGAVRQHDQLLQEHQHHRWIAAVVVTGPASTRSTGSNAGIGAARSRGLFEAAV